MDSEDTCRWYEQVAKMPVTEILSSSSLLPYSFVYVWQCWVFVAARRLSLVPMSRGYSVAVRGLLIVVASFVAEHRLSNYGA